jgi:acetylornithine deacetylase/succinyl-diaminopimelate desuccinylase-like protein
LATRTAGRLRYVGVTTAEKIPYAKPATGPAGHGLRPLRTNAGAPTQAVAKAAAWRPHALERHDAHYSNAGYAQLAREADRYNHLVDPARSVPFRSTSPSTSRGTTHAAHLHFAKHRRVVLPRECDPSEAVATPHSRAARRKFDAFVERIRAVVNDPVVKLVREARDTRPGAPPSPLNNVVFQTLEAMARKHYGGAVTLPVMQTGATDMAYLRARGMACYGIGPAVDSEDGPKGFGSHSDQERILASEVHRFIRFHYETVAALAAKN